MTANRLDYANKRLRIKANGSLTELTADSIISIDSCQMEDIANHGDEPFHLLHLANERFWIVGPFIDGGQSAITTLLADHSSISQRDVQVTSLPWKLRERGWFGLRLFPIAGLGEFPASELPALVPSQPAMSDG